MGLSITSADLVILARIGLFTTIAGAAAGCLASIAKHFFAYRTKCSDNEVAKLVIQTDLQDRDNERDHQIKEIVLAQSSKQAITETLRGVLGLRERPLTSPPSKPRRSRKPRKASSDSAMKERPANDEGGPRRTRLH